ncbi:hypothetical protein LCGC14_1269360 [marine sediment metagenome]|uniref:Uncharacterized protein n=1 Tax=marine sediment metagenome TaxID=412755 RepID=A0A0F9KYG8_9ZZZZ
MKKKSTKWARIGLGFYRCRRKTWHRQWIASPGDDIVDSDDDGKWWLTQQCPGLGPIGKIGPFDTRGAAILYSEGRFPRRWFRNLAKWAREWARARLTRKRPKGQVRVAQ